MRHRLIFGYLFAQHLRLALMVFACLFLIVLLGQFADMSRYQSEATGWTTLDTLKLSLFRTPTLLEAIIPHALLISSALAVARVSRRLEVAILMQYGLSPIRILFPVALAAAVFGAGFSLGVNPVATYTYNLAQFQLDSLSYGASRRSGEGETREMILRDGQGADYLLIDHVSRASDTLYGVRLYRVAEDHTLLYSLEAKRAVPVAEGWRLEDVSEMYRAPDMDPDAPLPRTLSLSSEVVEERYDEEETVSVYDLPGQIRLGLLVGAPVHELQIQFYWLAGLPLYLGAISLLAGAIVLRPLQRGGWKSDAATILAAAFTIYTLSTVLDALGIRSVISPVAATATLPLLCFVAALFVLWLKRGGAGGIARAFGARPAATNAAVAAHSA